MTDSSLLVPMHLDAMVLNQEASIATPFLRFQMNYHKLQSFESPQPRPFEGASTIKPDAGIYLYWTLPKALRHGKHHEDGSTDFPLVPNRWLIVRIQDSVNPDQAVKAWVLQSDYLDEKDGTSPFVHPTDLNSDGTPKPTRIGRALRFTAEVNSLAQQQTPFLRAIGPGNVHFSAFSPGVENVFSFRDDVTANDDKTPLQKGTFTYTVAGWHSDPSHDPLNQPDVVWQANPDPQRKGTYIITARSPSDKGDSANTVPLYDWFVYADSASLPRQMLIHALVCGVYWDRNADTPPAPTYPTDIQKTVKVAVGHTAIDALAAIVRLDKNNQVQADLLEAFQYGLLEHLDEPGSSEALNMAISQHWFGASPGGTRWTIVAKERSGDTSPPPSPTPSLTDQQKTALAALNAKQAEFDRQQRILESMQWNLLALWWKNQWQQKHDPPVDSDMEKWLATQLPLQVGEGSTANNPASIDPGQESWCIYQVKAQLTLMNQRKSEAETAKSDVQKLLDAQALELKSANNDVQALQLKSINRPQYYAPNDPVVLIMGLGRSTTFDPLEGVLCRLPSQTISELIVSGTTFSADVSSAGRRDIHGQIPVLTDPHALLPEGIQRLHTESFFLSPDLFAQTLLGGAEHGDDVRQAIGALPQPPSHTHVPQVNYARSEWVQPWIPLLLDWQITVLKEPAYTAPTHQPTCTFNQNTWQFDGTAYQWNGPTSAAGKNFDEADSGQMTLQGRTFLTPHLSFTLADQLEQYVLKHALRDPGLEALLENLEQYIEGIKNQDMLSQRLSGLLALMVERDYTQNLAPSGMIAGVLGQSRHGSPHPFPDEHSDDAAAPWDFAPLCGTFFEINKLSVIDAFGRTIDLMLANHSTNPQTAKSNPEDFFYPIAGRDMRAPTAQDPAPGRGQSNNAAERMLQLSPRLIQDSQLAFRLTASETPNADVDLVADATPICGWVVPNHVDRSIACYAPDGAAWGELALSRHAQEGPKAQETYEPVWQPDPTNPQAPQSVDAIPNSYVRALLQTLCNRADNGAAFSAFIRVIDETLWAVNPRGQRSDQHLSVLIGRPLAIVRARLSLQLRGLPFINQDWWNTFVIDPTQLPDSQQPAPLAAIDGGVRNFLWPVRLGSQVLRNDGLIGYYLDDPKDPAKSFQVFNTVLLPAGDQSDYLRQIGGQQNNYLQLRCIDDTVVSPDPMQNQVCQITMLVDPRGSIHAFTGLLPVVTLDVPSQYVTPALQKMSYLFRAGPLLTPPDGVRMPRPAERKGTWSWFDNVLKTTVPITQTDGTVSLPRTLPLVREGWLKFTPNPPHNGGKDV